MVLLVLYGIAAFLGVGYGIDSRHSMARLHLGRAIASERFLKDHPRGMQDAITDPSLNLLFFVWNNSVQRGAG